MNKLLILFLILGFAISSRAQGYKTFTDAQGKTYEIMQFNRNYTLDSCILLSKAYTGWILPDTTQFKAIHEQWFGPNNEHGQYPNETVDISGRDFIALPKVNGKYYCYRMGWPPEIFLTFQRNGAWNALYDLLLIRGKK